MGPRYIVVFEEFFSLPYRTDWVEQAWGDVPISYIQDDEDLNNCSFLDLKINKWELSEAWRQRHKKNPESTVRIEILKGKEAVKYLQEINHSVCEEFFSGLIVILELDEGWIDIDELLLLRMVSVFWGKAKIYKLNDSLEEVVDVEVFPELSTVSEQLMNF